MLIVNNILRFCIFLRLKSYIKAYFYRFLYGYFLSHNSLYEEIKMKKVILLLMVLLNLSQAKERIINTYTLSIEVEATKVNGKAWDVAGGAPDLLIKLNGTFLNFNKKCKNSYGCKLEFTFVNETLWYFEIYDKDLVSNDLIGKGNCSVGKVCILGGATIKISD